MTVIRATCRFKRTPQNHSNSLTYSNTNYSLLYHM